jgi:hypothetical protein
MASNFRVSTQKKSESVHLQLIGDFDGSSAWQLFDIIENGCKSANKVFIHTDTLNQIHPFGCSTFHKHLNILKRYSKQIVFTGEYASKLSP